MLWIIRDQSLYQMDHYRVTTLVGPWNKDTRSCPECHRAGMTMPTCTAGVPEPFVRYECMKGHHWQVYKDTYAELSAAVETWRHGWAENGPGGAESSLNAADALFTLLLAEIRSKSCPST